ncbi:SpaA isopeptide-forming pilin-related protein [Methanobrevibacter sp.]|uniref:SpaA isopeptide-forming pilin-related protein n=1 Tax=Methanobrevibacter sp. TaxID=66852 RepID=UPI0025EBEF9A|nr:hypothetical protein [Methanobrevibacter sp.]MBR4448560.1 hypothetical protein [Methanobrevibacter sp.]
MNKKIILLLFLLICICSISHASAADDCDVTSCDNSSDIEAQSIDEINVMDESDLIEDSNDEIGDVNPEYRDIQDQIDEAEEGATITLEGNYTCDYLININKSVKIVGLGDGAVLRYNGSNPLETPFFCVNASKVVISNIKFIGSVFAFGGAITWLGDEGSLENCEFTDNSAVRDYAIGGALLMSGNYCNVTNCTFTNNRAKYGGAILWNGTSGIIRNSVFRDNIAEDSESNAYGGALVIYEQCNCSVINSTFVNNKCSDYGGAIAILDTTENIRIVDCEFRDNSIDNSYFNPDKPQGGGAIFTATDFITIIDNCTFIDNKAENGWGGAVSLSGNDSLINSFFKGNKAKIGNDIVYGENITSNTFVLDYGETEHDAIAVNEKEFYKILENNIFNKTKANSSVTFSAGMIFEYGATGSIYVTVDGGTIQQKNIVVLKHPEAKITFANNVLTVSNLAVGTYTLRVTTTPDENHTAVDGDLRVTVNKARAVIKASKLTVALKSGAVWTIKIVDSRNNNPIANMKVTLKVYTGSKYKTVTLTTNSKGEASYKTKDLTKGTHKIVVSASHAGYNLNPVTSSITVVKQTALKFKLHKKVDNKKGSLRSYLVLNKKNKGINGVKIKCLIYTGNKYKTYALKSKKIKDGKVVYKGAIGFSTNDFSAGKHKVVLMPSSIKYKGSVTTYIKIKKAATKGPKFFRKV